MEPNERQWRNTAYWFAPRSLLSLLSSIPQGHLSRESTAPSGLGPSTSLIEEENVLKACSQANLMEASSQPRVLLPDDPGLCQVDNNQHITK